MQLFYDPDIQAGPRELRPEEAQHVARVLRKRPGDRIDLVDGRGGWFSAVLDEVTKRHVLLTATELRREARRAPHRTTLLVAPTKNIDRFEWLLEKATEIGVDRIVPVRCEHSERKRLRNDRLARVLESAMKQSLRAWLPELAELTPLDEALSTAPPAAQRLLAYLGAPDTPGLANTYRPGRDVVLAVGPEGGFGPAEAARARELGYGFVRLGPHRLRTETAAVVAVHTVEMMNWYE